MSLSRTLVLTGIGLTLSASMVLFAGCGGGNSEIDDATLIRKEAPKTDDGATPKPTAEGPATKEEAKP